MTCPLCNGIYTEQQICTCGATMKDAGLVTDYYGPYSPYFNLSFEDPICLHLFSCPVCGRELQVAVPITKRN
ncbi:hypothetical protein [Desulfofundulus sp.]|uniref:hypothetical protein n=1 Tax=Desulfofundulus sp. TaxID=2282750 RepID=UPI003C771EAE